MDNEHLLQALTDNGKERTAKGYANLCQKAGLKVLNIHQSSMVPFNGYHNINVVEVGIDHKARW